MANSAEPTIEVNGRRYRLPAQPTVVVCVDGCEFAYLDAAVAAGVAPFIGKLLDGGAAFRGDCVMPSFTNPNNVSIVCGVPPSVHGICGNHFWDPHANDGAGAEVMMNDPAYLRAGTLLAAAADAGATVGAVTAKDKLRRLLGWQLEGVCFSAEKAGEASREENGIDDVLALVGLPLPDVYSAALSEFVFAAGVRLAQTRMLDLMYLSTTDYIQHKWAPGTDGANAFFATMDGYLAQLDALGWVIGLTADHGHERQARSTDGRAERDLSAGRAGRLARRERGARDLADHRSVRRASRRARFVRDAVRIGNGRPFALLGMWTNRQDAIARFVNQLQVGARSTCGKCLTAGSNRRRPA